MLTGWLQICKWEGWENVAWRNCICLFVWKCTFQRKLKGLSPKRKWIFFGPPKLFKNSVEGLIRFPAQRYLWNLPLEVLGNIAKVRLGTGFLQEGLPLYKCTEYHEKHNKVSVRYHIIFVDALFYFAECLLKRQWFLQGDFFDWSYDKF